MSICPAAKPEDCAPGLVKVHHLDLGHRHIEPALPLASPPKAKYSRPVINSGAPNIITSEKTLWKMCFKSFKAISMVFMANLARLYRSGAGTLLPGWVPGYPPR